jgi:hypothetical protein
VSTFAMCASLGFIDERLAIGVAEPQPYLTSPANPSSAREHG